MFIDHDPYPPETQKAESAGFIMAGKLLTGKNMADLGQNRHFFPAIIIPSKVVLLFLFVLYYYLVLVLTH